MADITSCSFEDQRLISAAHLPHHHVQAEHVRGGSGFGAGMNFWCHPKFRPDLSLAKGSDERWHVANGAPACRLTRGLCDTYACSWCEVDTAACRLGRTSSATRPTPGLPRSFQPSWELARENDGGSRTKAKMWCSSLRRLLQLDSKEQP